MNLHAFRRYSNDIRGGVAIVFALLTVPLVVAAGGALDFARANAAEAVLQEALDAAVLAGVISASDAAALAGLTAEEAAQYQLDEARNYFLANSQGVVFETVEFHFEGRNLVGSTQGSVDTALLGLANIQTIAIDGYSVATDQPFRAPICVMAMHPTRKHTLELKDEVSVIAPDCNIYGNSDHVFDVVDPHNVENFLVGASVQAIGFGHHYLENVTPPLEHAPELIPDPFADLALPGSSECDDTESKINQETITIGPGIYCDGLDIHKSIVTMLPGVYIIYNHKFKIRDSVIRGDNVLIILGDSHVTLEWSTSDIVLSGRTSGDYAGFVLAGRNDVKHKLKGSIVDLEGVVYLPNGEFEWVNEGSPEMTADWTVWIVDGFTWKGSGTIYINFDPEGSDVPYPSELLWVIPRPGSPRLIG